MSASEAFDYNLIPNPRVDEIRNQSKTIASNALALIQRHQQDRIRRAKIQEDARRQHMEELQHIDEERHMKQDIVWRELELLKLNEDEHLERIAGVEEVVEDLSSERRKLQEQLEFTRNEARHLEETLEENSVALSQVNFKLGELTVDLNHVRAHMNEKVDLCRELEIILDEKEWRRQLRESLPPLLKDFSDKRAQQRQEAAERLRAEEQQEEEKLRQRQRIEERGVARANSLVEQVAQATADKFAQSATSLMSASVTPQEGNLMMTHLGSSSTTSHPAQHQHQLQTQRLSISGNNNNIRTPVSAAALMMPARSRSPFNLSVTAKANNNNNNQDGECATTTTLVDALNSEIRLLRSKIAALCEMNDKSSGRYASLRAKYDATRKVLESFRLSARETNFMTQTGVFAELQDLRDQYNDLFVKYYRRVPPASPEPKSYDPERDPDHKARGNSNSNNSSSSLKGELEIYQRQIREMAMRIVEYKTSAARQRRAMQHLEQRAMFSEDHEFNGNFEHALKLKALDEQMRHVVHHGKIQDPAALKERIVNLQESLENVRMMYNSQKEEIASLKAQLDEAEKLGFGGKNKKRTFADAAVWAVPSASSDSSRIDPADVLRSCSYEVESTKRHSTNPDDVVVAREVEGSEASATGDEQQREQQQQQRRIQLAARNKVSRAFLRAMSRAVDVIQLADSSEAAAQELEAFVFSDNSRNSNNNSDESLFSVLLQQQQQGVAGSSRRVQQQHQQRQQQQQKQHDDESGAETSASAAFITGTEFVQLAETIDSETQVEAGDLPRQSSVDSHVDVAVSTDAPPQLVSSFAATDPVVSFARATMTTPAETRTIPCNTDPVIQAHSATQVVINRRDVALMVFRPPPRMDLGVQAHSPCRDFAMKTDPLPVREVNMQTDPVPKPRTTAFGAQFAPVVDDADAQTDAVKPPTPPPEIETGDAAVQTDDVVFATTITTTNAVSNSVKDKKSTTKPSSQDDGGILSGILENPLGDTPTADIDSASNSHHSHSRPGSAAAAALLLQHRRQFSRPSSADNNIQQIPHRVPSLTFGGSTTSSLMGSVGGGALAVTGGIGSGAPPSAKRPSSALLTTTTSGRPRSAGGSVLLSGGNDIPSLHVNGGGEEVDDDEADDDEEDNKNNDVDDEQEPNSPFSVGSSLFVAGSPHDASSLLATHHSSVGDGGAVIGLLSSTLNNNGNNNDDDDDEDDEGEKNNNTKHLSPEQKKLAAQRERERRVEESVYLRLRLTQNALTAAEQRAVAANERYHLLRHALAGIYEVAAREVTDHELVSMTTELSTMQRNGRGGGAMTTSGGVAAVAAGSSPGSIIDRIKKRAGINNNNLLRLRLKKAVINASKYNNKFENYVAEYQERAADVPDPDFQYAYRVMSRRLPLEQQQEGPDGRSRGAAALLVTPNPHREDMVKNFAGWLSAKEVLERKGLDFLRKSRGKPQ